VQQLVRPVPGDAAGKNLDKFLFAGHKKPPKKRPWAEYDVVFCTITSRRGKDQMLFLDRIGGPVL
ncbi:MAG: hypothetical protein V8S34_01465, partial [Lawsonibacter sp.]